MIKSIFTALLILSFNYSFAEDIQPEKPFVIKNKSRLSTNTSLSGLMTKYISLFDVNDSENPIGCSNEVIAAAAANGFKSDNPKLKEVPCDICKNDYPETKISVDDIAQLPSAKNDPTIASEEALSIEFSKSFSGASEQSKVFYCGLSVAEYSILRAYVGSAYSQLNSALRSGTNLDKFGPIANVLTRALSKLKSFNGFVRRGASLPKEIFDKISVGTTFVDKAFLSTSMNLGFSSSTRFLLHSKTCAYVAPLSPHTNEKEVLCRAGTRFCVIYKNEGGSPTRIVATELLPGEVCPKDPISN